MGLHHATIRANADLRGWHNWHWVVRTGEDKLVLRRYWSERSWNYVDYERELLGQLVRKGWPVAESIAGPIQAGGHIWWALTYLPGRNRAPRTSKGVLEEQRSRGRLLAEFHGDLADCRGLNQRDGWVRAEEVFGPREHGPPLARVLEKLGRTRPEEARVLMSHAERAQSALQELGAAKLPAIPIHGDFTPWNLRYRQGNLTGILDFEFSHLDHRVADFALSWRGAHDAVVHGYNEVSPMTETEWQLLTPVWWAWLLEGARNQLLREFDSNLEWVMEHIVRRSELTGDS